MGCFIIAEAGVNHNGSRELALRLVEEAARTGADCVKFQTFSAERIATPGAGKAEYQKAQDGEGSQLEMLKSLELSEDTYRDIVTACAKHSIEFMSTPFDELSAEFLLGLGVKRFKIPSGEITNIPLVSYLASSGKKIILSTGMSTLDEVSDAVRAISKARSDSGFTEPLRAALTLLHCTSNYPAATNDLNLKAMLTIKSEFGVPVGYSDHTKGILIAPVAVGMGAVVIEKHLTLDVTLPGPDHAASIEPGEFSRMTEAIREVEAALGDGRKIPVDSELPVRDIARKSVTLKGPVPKGSLIALENLTLMRPGSGIAPSMLTSLVGRRVKMDLDANHTLKWTDLEE